MTRLRQRMIEDMEIRNLSPNTHLSYLQQVSSFAKYCHRSPELVGPEEIRAYQVHLTIERKFAPGTGCSSNSCTERSVPVRCTSTLTLNPCATPAPSRWENLDESNAIAPAMACTSAAIVILNVLSIVREAIRRTAAPGTPDSLAGPGQTPRRAAHRSLGGRTTTRDSSSAAARSRSCAQPAARRSDSRRQ
jgi:hypothetical protein